jgi:hypothetical protein
MTLFDMLQNAQGGQTLDLLAKQYQLSMQQTQAAVDALLPAFSAGFKRQAGNPASFPNLFEAMLQAKPVPQENPMEAFARQAIEQGNRVLGVLFGSKEVSRAVADQAAALTGIGTDVLKAMLPAMAALLASSFVRMMTAQPQMEAMVRQMMTGAAGFGFPQPAERPTVQPNPHGGGLLGALLGSMIQQGVQQANAWSTAMGGGEAGASAKPSGVSAKPSGASAKSSSKGKSSASKAASSDEPDMVGQMFETGRQIQQAHLDSIQAIFDAFAPPRPKG